jgi:hypothetical protein
MAPQVSVLADGDLLLRAALEIEMRKRGIAFTVGEVGEQLAVEHFTTTRGLPKLQHAPTGTKNVDALSRNGDSYSIKAIFKGKKTRTICPDTGDADKQLFEYLLIVRLSDSWALRSIHQLSWGGFLDVRSWDKRMNASYVPISSKALSRATVMFETSVG